MCIEKLRKDYIDFYIFTHKVAKSRLILYVNNTHNKL